jgi:formylglycine-generating enzyme required for sulfatase activity
MSACATGCADLLDIDEGREGSGGNLVGGTGATSEASSTSGTSAESGASAGPAASSAGSGGAAPGMIAVPAGSFAMGCNTRLDDECDSDESPYHQVNLSAFQIDAVEVSRGAYRACIDAGACATPTCDWHTLDLVDHPVTCVTWDDASAYCEFVGKRLPTEAEWEKAARADGGHKYPWKAEFAGDCDLVNANLCELDTTPVGEYPQGASPYGVLDMSGNAAEWVHDLYDAGYYAASPTADPPGPSSGGVRVHRGGSWNSPTEDFRCSSRSAATATTASDEIGFRCAL